MSDNQKPIEFEVPTRCRLITHNLERETGTLYSLTTPAEFDAVARKMGYVKQDATPGSFSEIVDTERKSDESRIDTLRRIIAERDKYKSERDVARSQETVTTWGSGQTITWVPESLLKEATSHTCNIDGDTYHGNEETIGKMQRLEHSLNATVKIERSLRTDLAGAYETIDDLKRQLAEAMGLSKMRDGLFGVSRYVKVAQRLNENSKDARPMRAMKNLADAIEDANEHTVPRMKAAATVLLNWLWDNWLAAELEKGGG